MLFTNELDGLCGSAIPVLIRQDEVSHQFRVNVGVGIELSDLVALELGLYFSVTVCGITHRQAAKLVHRCLYDMGGRTKIDIKTDGVHRLDRSFEALAR